MGVLIPTLLLALFSTSVLAAPPVDLSDFDGGAKNVKRKVKPLKDKDLIFTDNLGKVENQLNGIVEFKEITIGRIRPDVRRRPVMKFQPQFRARFLQFSPDNRWIAVELLNGKRRAWVPIDKVNILDKNIQKKLNERQSR